MRGRRFRREAGSSTEPHIADRLDSAPRRRPRAAAALVAPLLVLALLLIAPPVPGIGLTHAAAAKCKHARSGPGRITRSQARNAVICLVNKKRHRLGERRLDKTRALDQSAGRHTSYMHRHWCYSHQCPGEAGLEQRVYDTSYLPCNCTWGLAENLDWAKRGRATPRAIVRGWMASPAHRGVLLDGQLQDIGVGVGWVSPNHPTRRAGIYTADFGYRRR